jgi:hypothetical protein
LDTSYSLVRNLHWASEAKRAAECHNDVALLGGHVPDRRRANDVFHEGVPDVFAMPVTTGSGQTFTWSLELSKPERHRVSLSLNDGQGRSL